MFEDISQSVIRIAIMAVPFMLAVTCHEVAHGLAALRYGDPTAKMAGRLTLNPLRHLDPMGSLMFILTAMVPGGFIIGWAKPVPVNPRYFKNYKQATIVVSAAGAAANVVLAFLFWLAYKAIQGNPPLMAGSTWAFFYEPLYLIGQFGVVINVVLAVFNLLPIPPLDGSKILAQFLPPQMAYKYMSYERYGFIILIALVMLGGLRFILAPVWALLQWIL